MAIKVVDARIVRSVNDMISMTSLSKLAPARRRRRTHFDINADFNGQRRTGDPRLDLAILERRSTF